MANLIVGVTGGIGSGKSAVMQAFEWLGIVAEDADVMARVVVEPGKPALKAIVEHFGPDVLAPDGSLNRPALRQVIFSDANAKLWLENLLHPLINQELEKRLAAAQSPYALLVSPLLFETGQNRLVDRVLVVDVPEALQLERASKRDGVDVGQIQRIMASQMDRQERLARANEVLDNSGDLASMQQQVERLHREYLSMSSAAR
ncbi:dephospho-CoA kinase [Marinimicrobium agarilyticum]|uniref:dephospho-CoA kinase n=1 Tax=Marinimicrobium agarilyticum TaxID=306546 RepID=UPI000414B28A|nr:dephospho-CoA kinase [Marinimicrobium agarilyticum]